MGTITKKWFYCKDCNGDLYICNGNNLESFYNDSGTWRRRGGVTSLAFWIKLHRDTDGNLKVHPSHLPDSSVNTPNNYPEVDELLEYINDIPEPEPNHPIIIITKHEITYNYYIEDADN